MKILFIGDVVGSPGRSMIEEYLPKLKSKYKPNLTIVNGENAASGKGITESIYKQFLGWGAQVITMGNHTWDRSEEHTSELQSRGHIVRRHRRRKKKTRNK